MAETITDITIDRVALRRVIDAPVESVTFVASEEVIDAVANLRKVLDGQLVLTLKADAKYLLSISLPNFDHDRVYPLPALEAIQVACSDLQDAIKTKVVGLERLGAEAVHPAVKPLLETVLESFKRAFVSAESLRWIAMNAEAEAEIRAGGGKSFGSMDAALAYLAKQR